MSSSDEEPGGESVTVVGNCGAVWVGESLKAIGKVIPVGFAGEPRDIAKVAVFLASDDARYIVGQTLVVDGGTTSWMPFGEGFKEPMKVRFGKGYVPGI